MEQDYRDTARMLRAISDPKRLRIMDMLSCGELCACQILAAFSVTQPTLSHDMRVLLDAGLVTDRREGKNTFYALSANAPAALLESLGKILTPKDDCICRTALQSRCDS